MSYGVCYTLTMLLQHCVFKNNISIRVLRIENQKQLPLPLKESKVLERGAGRGAVCHADSVLIFKTFKGQKYEVPTRSAFCFYTWRR